MPPKVAVVFVLSLIATVICSAERVSLQSFGNSNYVFIRVGGSWFAGQKLCTELGGSLAVVNSPGEWEHIYGELKRLVLAYCWLGGFKIQSSWRWITGEELAVEKSPWHSPTQINLSGQCIMTESPTWGGQSITKNWRVANCTSWDGDKFRKDFYPLCEIRIPRTENCPTGIYQSREISFTTGQAGASNDDNNNNNNNNNSPTNAFVRDSFRSWISGNSTPHNGGQQTPPSSFPVSIWYDLKTESVCPTKISFRAKQYEYLAGCDYAFNQGGCGATKFQFIGSNDLVCNEFSTWKVLCQDLSGKIFQTQRQRKICIVEKSVGNFRCLGLRVLESSASRVVVDSIRMWRRV